MPRTPTTGVLIAIFAIALLPAMAAVSYLIAVRPASAYWWTWGIGLCQILIAEAMRRRFYRDRLPVFSLTGWPWAVAALVGLQALQYTVAVHTAQPVNNVFVALELIKYLVFVAYAEEILFRGLWFEMFGRRWVPCVLIGSVVFGLYHLPHGWQTVLLTTFVGAVFAAARYRGASVLTLAVAHGLVNWLNLRVFPAAAQRFDEVLFVTLFSAGCVLLVVLMFPFRRGAEGSIAAK